MKNIKNIFILLVILISFSACGSMKKAFENEKKGGSEAFLVKKKSPLVMPPSYGNLPEPDKLKKKDEEKVDLKEIITGSKNVNQKIDKNNSIEKLILKKIKKD